MLWPWEKSSMPHFRRFLMTNTQQFLDLVLVFGAWALESHESKPAFLFSSKYHILFKPCINIEASYFSSQTALPLTMLNPAAVSSAFAWLCITGSLTGAGNFLEIAILQGLRILFSISPLIGSSRDWFLIATVRSNLVQVMPLPALRSCRSSSIKIQADLGPQHSRNLYGSTYFWALFWRHKLRLFCAMLLLLLVLILDCTKTLGIVTEAQLNNLPPTKFKSNPSRSSENVSTLAWDLFFLPGLNSFVLPYLGQDWKPKYLKAPDNIFIAYGFDPSRC